MQILIKLYDEEQILNLISAYVLSMDKVFFLYKKEQENLIHNPLIERLIRTETEYIEYTYGTLAGILQRFSNDTVYVDVHGGDDLAVSMVSQFAKDDGYILVYPGMTTGQIYFLEGEQVRTEKLEMPKLTVRQIIELNGGSVRNLPESYFDDHGRKAVEECLNARRKNARKWNAFCKAMGALGNRQKESDVWIADEKFFRTYDDVLEKLRHVFDEIRNEDGKTALHFHDSGYKILVTDTGVPFEYETYYQILDSGAFDDEDLRVNIDWNGGAFVSGDPNSELDVVASKDSRLISISCKAGKYDQQAIYEVKANADKFGGERAVPVLCVDIETEKPEYVEKARELNVLLIEHRQMLEKKAAQLILEWMETH